MTFTSREFRDALGLFPTGIAVVCASDAGGRLAGVTVNSFTSVSLDPPLVLACLARSSRSIEIFNAAQHFAVTLLADGQRHISTIFASTTADRFAEVPHRIGLGGCPIIEPNLASFECDAYSRHDGGDHVLLLGKVVQIAISAGTPPRPLLYFRGQYRELSEQHVEIAPFRLEGW